MKIRKLILSFLFILLLCLMLLHLCSAEGTAEQNWRVRVVEAHTEQGIRLVIIRDFQNKRDYLVVDSPIVNGPMAVTPLLEAK